MLIPVTKSTGALLSSLQTVLPTLGFHFVLFISLLLAQELWPNAHMFISSTQTRSGWLPLWKTLYFSGTHCWSGLNNGTYSLMMRQQMSQVGFSHHFKENTIQQRRMDLASFSLPACIFEYTGIQLSNTRPRICISINGREIDSMCQNKTYSAARKHHVSHLKIRVHVWWSPLFFDQSKEQLCSNLLFKKNSLMSQQRCQIQWTWKEIN